jgi:hypothetical protein
VDRSRRGQHPEKCAFIEKQHFGPRRVLPVATSRADHCVQEITPKRRGDRQSSGEAFGIGTDTAAEMLILADDNFGRIHSEAAFAKLCGACPIPASSGTTQRHRLNYGGHRQANSALYRTVIVRMRFHQPTIDYVTRRTAEGKSKREIIRYLKRYVAREIYFTGFNAPRTPERALRSRFGSPPCPTTGARRLLRRRGRRPLVTPDVSVAPTAARAQVRSLRTLKPSASVSGT